LNLLNSFFYKDEENDLSTTFYESIVTDCFLFFISDMINPQVSRPMGLKLNRGEKDILYNHIKKGGL